MLRFINDVTVEASMKKYDGNTGIAVLSSVPRSQVDEDMNAISVAKLGNSLTTMQGTMDRDRKSAWHKLFDTDRKYHICDK